MGAPARAVVVLVGLAFWLAGCGAEPVAVRSTGGEQPAPEPPGVLLRFAWPASLHARVGVEVRDGSPTAPLVGAVSYELSTVPTAEGLRVDFHDLRVLQPFAMGELPAPVVEQLALLRPSLRVDRDGAFLGVVDAEARIAQALKALTAEPTFVELLRQRATPSSLTADASMAWHDLVEFWAGERLEPGRNYWIRNLAPLPVLGGEEVELVTSYQIKPGQPCDEYDPTNACVLLTIHVEPDPGSLAALVQRLNQAARAAAGGKNLQLVPRIENVEASTHLELLTEPGTLLPRQLTRVRRALKQVDDAGDLIEDRKLRHELHRYQYLAR
jgi:hypothetical protein